MMDRSWIPPPLPETREPTADQLWAQYKDVARQLAEAQDRHSRAAEELKYAGDLCLAMSAEKERLWLEVQRAVDRESGLGGASVTVEAETGAARLYDALRGIPEPVDQGA